MTFRRYCSAKKYDTTKVTDYLANRITRLSCHKAYPCSEILSAHLWLFLPHRQVEDRAHRYAAAHEQLKRARLEPTMLAYLILSVDAELDLANGRMALA